MFGTFNNVVRCLWKGLTIFDRTFGLVLPLLLGKMKFKVDRFEVSFVRPDLRIFRLVSLVAIGNHSANTKFCSSNTRLLVPRRAPPVIVVLNLMRCARHLQHIPVIFLVRAQKRSDLYSAIIVWPCLIDWNGEDVWWATAKILHSLYIFHSENCKRFYRLLLLK